MQIKLHANATTTPKTRRYIQESSASVAELAAELGVSETTVRRWRSRRETGDRSHVRHRLGQSTSPQEEALICALRTDAGLSLDDVVEVMHRCVNASLSRSAVYRCLKRHGLSGRPPAPGRVRPQAFEPTEPGFVHVDLKHLTRLQGRPAYVFVAIERTTRFAHVEVIASRRQEVVAAAFERFLDAFALPVHTVLSDNGSEFTDRFGAARYYARKTGTGRHAFDQVCAAHAITHKLTRPYTPQTNGMVERFNRRLSEALRSVPPNGDNQNKNRFHTHQERNRFILQTVDAYNHTRLRCLNYTAPRQALNNLTKDNTFAGMTIERTARIKPHTPCVLVSQHPHR